MRTRATKTTCAARSPLVGRSGELDALGALLDKAAGGAGQMALVEGEAGVGKTRLVEEVIVQAQAGGLAVFTGTAEELETRRPFGVVADALGVEAADDPVRSRIAAMLVGQTEAPQSMPKTAANVEFRVSEAILELVEDLSAEAPLLVVAEDLQWADPSSVFALHRLGRHLATLPIMLVCTARTLPRRPELAQLVDSLRTRGATDVVLDPLGQESLPALVEGLVGAPPGSQLLRQAAGAGGNPFFVTAVVEALAEERAIKMLPGGKADISAVALPSSLGKTILHRLSFLPDDTLEVLRLASVLGTHFTVRDLSTVSGRPVTSLATALSHAQRGKVLRERGQHLAFRHELVREALYGDLSLSTRVALHRDFASALADGGGDRLVVAEHVVRGAAPGDEEAIDWLHRTAQEVAPQAPTVTVDLLQRALVLAEGSEVVRARLRPELAIALMWAGRSLEGEALCRELLAGPVEPSVEVRLRLHLTQSLLLRARARDALDQARAGLASAGVAGPQRARMQAWTSLPLLFVGDADGAVTMARQAHGAAEAIGDVPAACQALKTLSLVAYVAGRFTDALTYADQAVVLADRSESREAHRSLPHAARAVALLRLDRLDEGQVAAQTGRAISEEFGMKATLPIYHVDAATAHFLAGRWGDAVSEALTGVDLAQETATGWVLVGHSIRALVALHRGDVDAGAHAVDDARHELAHAKAQEGVAWGMAWILLAQARVLEMTGRSEDAFAALRCGLEACERSGAVSETPVLGPDLVRLALAAGQRPVAETATRIAEDLAAENAGVASLVGVALRCRGLLDDDGDTLLHAAETLRGTPRLLERAHASEDAAAHLAATGRVADARRLLHEALDLYATFDAALDARRAESRLRASGVRRGASGRRGRPKSGWASLTHTERAVAELVAQGLTNVQVAERLFISRHTVHTHVSHILSKLGLCSRVELAASRRSASR